MNVKEYRIAFVRGTGRFVAESFPHYLTIGGVPIKVISLCGLELSSIIEKCKEQTH